MCCIRDLKVSGKEVSDVYFENIAGIFRTKVLVWAG